MNTARTLKADAPGASRLGGQPLYRIMVVDDSAVIRGYMARMLEAGPEFKVVTTAANGKIAVAAIATSTADIVILDIEMPVMDGLTALPLILKAKPGVKIIMSSTLTRRNAAVSIKALAAGASDYVPKPTSVREVHASENFRGDIFNKIRALVKPDGRSARAAKSGAPALPAKPTSSPAFALREPSRIAPGILAIGSSTGGPQALFTLFEELKATIDVPILITQHMPATFTTILAEHLQRICGVPCAEGRDQEPVVPGRIYMAPGEFHMVVEARGSGLVVRLNKEPPENYCRPAVDPMFRSIAKIYGAKTFSLVLTGMGQDGLVGGQAIVDAGGTVIAQDEATSIVWGMPGAVAKAGICSAALPLSEIAPFITGKFKRVRP